MKDRNLTYIRCLVDLSGPNLTGKTSTGFQVGNLARRAAEQNGARQMAKNRRKRSPSGGSAARVSFGPVMTSWSPSGRPRKSPLEAEPARTMSLMGRGCGPDRTGIVPDSTISENDVLDENWVCHFGLSPKAVVLAPRISRRRVEPPFPKLLQMAWFWGYLLLTPGPSGGPPADLIGLWAWTTGFAPSSGEMAIVNGR